MAVAYSTLWDRAKELVLEQYKSSPNLKGLIQAAVEECAQPLEDAAFNVQNFLDVTIAEGEWLDVLGKLVNVKRNGGETDTDFRARIVAKAKEDSAGTPDNVIYNAAVMSGDPEPQYMDEADCTFMVYTGPRNENAVPDGQSFDYEHHGEGALTGGADQLYARQVKKLAPAGVLGLVGAAIMTDEGLLGDAQGRLILAVADDSTVTREMVLVNDNLVPVVNAQNQPVRAVIKGTTVPKVEVNMGGQYFDGVRIKDLPDAGDVNGFIPRDSDAEGTRKTKGIGVDGMDELWDSTKPEE